MSVMLATLCLNEMQWLPLLYEQYKDFPELARWVFVEAADRVYAETNPSLVSPAGLSVDGTTEFLRELAERDPRVMYIPHGLSRHADPAQCKVEARQRYLSVAESVRTEFVYVVDADEFLTHADQRAVLDLMRAAPRTATAFCFRQRHVWRPPSIASEPLFRREVVGGYWRIPHCRGWRWQKGMRYVRDHNAPEDHTGRSLGRRMERFDEMARTPETVHLGFASDGLMRAGKHAYYQARGEGKADGRQLHVECRAAWESWQPGGRLPGGARVQPYQGPIPEVFQRQGVCIG